MKCSEKIKRVLALGEALSMFNSIKTCTIICLITVFSSLGITATQAQPIDGSLIFRDTKLKDGWKITFDPKEITFLKAKKNSEYTTELRAVPRSTLRSLASDEREKLLPSLAESKQEFFDSFNPLVVMSDGKIIENFEITGRKLLREMVFWGSGPFALNARIPADTQHVKPSFVLLRKNDTTQINVINDTSELNSSVEKHVKTHSDSVQNVRFYGKNSKTGLWGVNAKSEKGYPKLYFLLKENASMADIEIPKQYLRGPSSYGTKLKEGADIDRDGIAEVIFILHGKPLLLYLENQNIQLLNSITPH